MTQTSLRFSAEDKPRIDRLLDRVRELMRDGTWRTFAQIRARTGGSENGVAARLRELRQRRYGSYEVARRPVPGVSGLFEYRVSGGVW